MADLNPSLRWIKAINWSHWLGGHFWGVNESRIILHRLAAKCITEIHRESYRFIVCSDMTAGIKVIDDSTAGNANQDVVNGIDDTTMTVKKVVGEGICKWGD